MRKSPGAPGTGNLYTYERRGYMARKFKSMDGNEAAAYVSYAFTEVAGI